jgi:hypothetical protein
VLKDGAPETGAPIEAALRNSLGLSVTGLI